LNQSNHHIARLEHDKFIVAKRDDGIYHVYLKDRTVLDLALQKEMLDFYRQITNNIDGLFIFEAGHMCNVTKQARENAILIEDEVPVCASVVYVQNLVYKMIANFFNRFNKPKQPYLVVTNFDEGIKWLKSLKPHQINRGGVLAK
jgi:hypothetical protein